VIGTDPAVANAGVIQSPQLVSWYNGSFYGTVTRMEPNDPFPGYMPPPLDGIWATAPYFHNGSVPSVELVLNMDAYGATRDKHKKYRQYADLPHAERDSYNIFLKQDDRVPSEEEVLELSPEPDVIFYQ